MMVNYDMNNDNNISAVSLESLLSEGGYIPRAARGKVIKNWLAKQDGKFPPRLPKGLLFVYQQANPDARLALWVEFG